MEGCWGKLQRPQERHEILLLRFGEFDFQHEVEELDRVFECKQAVVVQIRRGIKDSPPYLHDDRLLTLEDTVEFFNLVLETKLTEPEKKDLVAFLRAL